MRTTVRPSPVSMRRCAVGAAIGVVCATGMAACSSPSDPPDASRHPEPHRVRVEKDGSGLVTKAPDIGQVVARSIPPEVAKGRYWHDPFNSLTKQQFFSWKVFDANHNRNLTLQVVRETSVSKAKKGAVYVKDVLADDHVREGRQIVDTGKAAAINGIADECLTFHISRKNAMSALPGDFGQEYSMSGRHLYCRFANVNIWIDWEGLNYSRQWTFDSGTGLNDAIADSDTQRIARTIVAALRGA
jgi:hypothetical protein